MWQDSLDGGLTCYKACLPAIEDNTGKENMQTCFHGESEIQNHNPTIEQQ
jgi:hypothetical protein